MASLTTETVRTLQDFIRLIDLLITDPKDPYWFRGVAVDTYDLLPSLYRHPTLKTKDEFLQLETSLIHRFSERAVPYLSSHLSTPWEFIFLMQHYEIPTRLLDWTENPMVALFFALTTAPRDMSTGTVTSPCAVWALSPRLWNARAFSHVSFCGGPLSVSHRLLKPYTPLSDDEPPALPAAIFGIHNSPRIVAQRGVFTIYGSITTPMQDVFAAESFSDASLLKYLIPSDAVDPMMQKLYATGFTEAVMFPGLDGLAKETKRLFGFKE